MITENDIRNDLAYVDRLQATVRPPDTFDLTDEELSLIDAYLSEDQKDMIQEEISRYKPVTDMRGKLIFKALASFYSLIPELELAARRGWSTGDKSLG